MHRKGASQDPCRQHEAVEIKHDREHSHEESLLCSVQQPSMSLNSGVWGTADCTSALIETFLTAVAGTCEEATRHKIHGDAQT